MKFILHCPN